MQVKAKLKRKEEALQQVNDKIDALIKQGGQSDKVYTLCVERNNITTDIHFLCIKHENLSMRNGRLLGDAIQEINDKTGC